LDLHRVPVKVRPLLQRCLDRDPKRRLRDIGDAWLLLDETATAAPPRPSNAATAWKMAAALLAVTSAATPFALLRTAHQAPAFLQSWIKLALDLGQGTTLGSSSGRSVVLSPAGNHLVFVSRAPSGATRLCPRAVAQPRAVLMADPDGASGPFFSPDSAWVG